MKGEEWRPIIGWEGYYEASNRGRIRSLERIVAKQDGSAQKVEAKILKGTRRKSGTVFVSLRRSSKSKELPVARLVLEAFEGPTPGGIEIRHRNGDVGNNQLSNLDRVLPFQNDPDANVEEADKKAKRSHCKRGHEFNAANTIYRREKLKTRRNCRACFFVLLRHKDISPTAPEFKELADKYYAIFQEEITHA